MFLRRYNFKSNCESVLEILLLSGEVSQTSNMSSIEQPVTDTNAIGSVDQQPMFGTSATSSVEQPLSQTNDTRSGDQQLVVQTNDVRSIQQSVIQTTDMVNQQQSVTVTDDVSNHGSIEQQPGDHPQSNDIIMAASIASGIDNLAAAALECEKLVTQEDNNGVISPNPPQDASTTGETPVAEDDTKEVDDHDMVEVPLTSSSAIPPTGEVPNPDVENAEKEQDDSDDELDGNVRFKRIRRWSRKLDDDDFVEISLTGTPTVGTSPTGNKVPIPKGDDESEEEMDDSEKELNDHDVVEISLASYNISCSFCSSAFKNQTDLKQHFATEHRINSNEQIEKLVTDLTKKKRPSVKKTSPGRPCGRKRLRTDCEVCDKVFATRKSYLKHTRSKKHLATVQVQGIPDVKGKELKKRSPRGRKRLPTDCELCDKFFSTRKNYRKHIKSKYHLGRVQAHSTEGAQDKKYTPCSQCSFLARHPKELKIHTKKRHSRYTKAEIKEVPINRGRGRPRIRIRKRAVAGVCPQCGKQLKGKVLTLHIARCQAKNALCKCSECGKSVVKKALYRHQRRCINKKHLICPLCKHQSRERYDYTVHIDTHKTWLPAELGDMPPPKHETVDGVREQDDKNQDHMGVSQEDGNNKGQVNNLGEDAPLNTPVMIQSDVNDMQMPESEGTNHFPINGDGSNLMETSQSNTQTPDTLIATEKDEWRNTRQKQLQCHVCENWYQRSDFKHHMFTIHNLIQKFKCRVDNCSKANVDIDQFLEHAKTHGDDLPFTCECRSCLIKNANPENQEYIKQLKKQKLKEYYKAMIYKCTKCWLKFPSPEALEKHDQKESHTHPCEVCGKVLFSRRQLRMHMVTHNDERNFLCEECGASFKTQRDLKKHRLLHSDYKPYVCQECGKGFLFKNKLDRHQMTVHSNIKPFKCTFGDCERAFSRRDKLTDHARTHLNYEPFRCRFCPKGFYRKDKLKVHEALHTKDQGTLSTYKCSICLVKFPNPEELESHKRMETHSHPCPTCGKIQVSKQQLQVHMVTHVEERNFLCEDCGASFTSKQDLQKHCNFMMHSNFKPFTCQECGKGFTAKNKLDRHQMTVHSKEKPFKCTFENCEKAFSRRDKLTDHARTHLNYEPFHCRFCSKGFFRKDNLKEHEVLHTKDYPYKCEKCPKGFMRPKMLARHMAHDHGIQNAHDANGTEGAEQFAKLMPLKLTKSKSHQQPSMTAAIQAGSSMAAALQAGSTVAAALQQAMQSVNAGAEGMHSALPPEVLQAYHLYQHGSKDPQHYQVAPMVGAEEQIPPNTLHERHSAPWQH